MIGVSLLYIGTYYILSRYTYTHMYIPTGDHTYIGLTWYPHKTLESADPGITINKTQKAEHTTHRKGRVKLPANISQLQFVVAKPILARASLATEKTCGCFLAEKRANKSRITKRKAPKNPNHTTNI